MFIELPWWRRATGDRGVARIVAHRVEAGNGSRPRLRPPSATVCRAAAGDRRRRGCRFRGAPFDSAARPDVSAERAAKEVACPCR